MPRVPIEELVSGMIISEDVYNAAGNLILNNGFSITNPTLVKNILHQNDISMVKVLILPSQVPETEIEKQINQTIHEEIQDFSESFQDNASQIRNQIERASEGEIHQDFFNDLMDTALSKSKDSFLNIFQLIQKTKAQEDLTFSHCYSVSLTAHALGEWLGLQGEELKELTLAALLSDLGKSMVNNEILYKKTPLSEEELIEIRNHVTYSGKVLEKLELSEKIQTAILFHHEREDGSGYPFGIPGEDIPFFSKIIAVADVYSALTSNRPYRRQYTPLEAMQLMERDFIKLLDVTILTEFLKRISNSYIGNPVTLSNGEKGKIIFMSPRNYARPIIKIDGIDHIVDLSLPSNHNLQIVELN